MITDMLFCKLGGNEYSCNVDEQAYLCLKEEYKYNKQKYLTLVSDNNNELQFDMIVKNSTNVGFIIVDKETRVIKSINLFSNFFTKDMTWLINSYTGFTLACSRSWF